MLVVDEAVTGRSTQVSIPASASNMLAPSWRSPMIVGPLKVDVPVTSKVPTTWRVELGVLVDPTIVLPVRVLVAVAVKVAT